MYILFLAMHQEKKDVFTKCMSVCCRIRGEKLLYMLPGGGKMMLWPLLHLLLLELLIMICCVQCVHHYYYYSVYVSLFPKKNYLQFFIVVDVECYFFSLLQAVLSKTAKWSPPVLIEIQKKYVAAN